MDDVYGKVEVFPHHFQAAKASDDCLQTTSRRADFSLRSRSHSWAVRSVMGAASMLNLFSLQRLPWASSTDDDDKVELTKVEVEALQSEIAEAEEREAYLKAQLEHLDELLRSARLSGYLYIRTRWAELPGEPPILDDADVDDWLPRFVVLHGPCIFYYLKSTARIIRRQGSSFHCRLVQWCSVLPSQASIAADLSPQDTTLLSDVVELGSLPSFIHAEHQRRYTFYILTCHGLRFECSSISEMQVDSWLSALRRDCNLEPVVAQKDLIES